MRFRLLWKTGASLCICLSLAVCGTAYGAPSSQDILIVPPLSTAGSSGTTGETASAGPSGTANAGGTVAAGPSGTANTGTVNSVTTVKAPEIQAEGAVLLDASTGKVLYGKNENTRYYPASITKLMTAMLVLENCGLNDTVTFSETATTNLESGSVSLKLTAGDKLSVKDCLYALLLKSANEVANGLAEHTSGSISAFVDQMNARAKALGCTGTHFANPNGLNDSQHYSTPYDMALIARAAFQNTTLCQINGTLSYTIPATKNVSTTRTISLGHKMFYPNDSRYYEGIIGGKTGYTSLAGNTLVTCVERDGVRLIAVVMKAKSTHYTDTKALLDYGFEHYQALQAGGSGVNRWVQDSTGWYFIKADGSRAASQWLTIDGSDYWFEANGYMATGWKQFSDGSWYYLRSSGAKAVNRWIENNSLWFYLGSTGAMLTGTTTPDGYQVGANGAWIS